MDKQGVSRTIKTNVALTNLHNSGIIMLSIC